MSELAEKVSAHVASIHLASAHLANADPPPWAANATRPFIGLRPFDYWDHHFFFGREAHAHELYRMLDRSRFVAVVGSSGGGKSSLVRAGLLPLLDKEDSEAGGRAWLWAELRPGDEPITRLAHAIAKLDPAVAAGSDPKALTLARAERIETTLRRSSLGLVQVLAKFQMLRNKTLLLLVDQFEELFRYSNLRENTHCDAIDRAERVDEATAFVQLLLEAARDRGLPVRVIITMRSDFIGDCGRYLGLAETVSASQFLVPQLTRDELEATIRKPIAKVGARIAPELVQTLINDVSDDQDQLPVLQHALMRTWDAALSQEAPRHLTMEHYEAIGTLSTALSQHADEIMGELQDLVVEVEQAFRALAELDRGNHAVRRPRPFNRLLAETGIPEADLRRVLDRFRREDCSFLVPPLSCPVAGDTIIDVGHEALIRRWKRMCGNIAIGEAGWLRAEVDDGNTFRGLLALAGGGSSSGNATLPLDQIESRWSWWTSRPRTEAWAARYGGGLDSVRRLFENSLAALKRERERRNEEQRLREEVARQERERLRLENEQLKFQEERARLEAEKAHLEQQALSSRLEEQTKLARERSRRARLAAIAALASGALVVGLIWALIERERADQRAIETQAIVLWSRLELWRDPLPSNAVQTLWDLAQADEKVRVAFVHQMEKDEMALRRFGNNPPLVARAVGLQWPEKARQAAKRSVAQVASDGFDPEKVEPSTLVAYTRAVAALAPERLDQATAEAASKNIARALDRISAEPTLEPRSLLTLALAVKSMTERLEAKTFSKARERIREEIGSANSDEDNSYDRKTMGHTIDVMATYLTPDERAQAVRYLFPILGERTGGAVPQSIPRALKALLPEPDPGQAREVIEAVLAAIAEFAAPRTDDSSYLLALIHANETLIDKLDDTAVAGFGEALAEQFAKGGGPLPQAALARAAIPFLKPSNTGATDLIPLIAAATFPTDPENAGRSLRQAVFSPSGDREGAHTGAEEVLRLLLDEWAKPLPKSKPNLYRYAAQARLLETMAPLLGKSSVSGATAGLLKILPRMSDYLAREAFAGALETLAPQMSDDDREKALMTAKLTLAKTGSTEEATAWAGAVAALLPADCDKFTRGIVEVLKYPNTAGEPQTVVLLKALTQCWYDDKTIIDAIRKKRVTEQLREWFEQQLRDNSLAEPPKLNLESAELGNAGPGSAD